MDLLTAAYGTLAGASALWTALGTLLAVVVLGFAGAPLWLWTVAAGGLLFGLGVPAWAWAVFGVPALVFNVPPLRRALVTAPAMRLMKAMEFLPRISDTERIAIEAGTVWMDGELFSGRPDLERLAAADYPDLTDEEQAFLDGPVEELCRMTSDWDVFQRRDLSREAWEYIRRQRFLGMIVPKEYDGLGFSATAHSAVVAKLASRSTPLAIIVMVPNSLGPAELLIHYGTEEQKRRWLPGLARGEEIPCFALTEPQAGSDAASLTASGEVFRDDDDGDLKLRLNWDKRYISLAAVSTVLGLAFRLRDPDDLLGKGTDPGITCALVPTAADGVVLGRLHDPLGVPFFNSPTEGHDVVVDVDAIIGGPDGAGRGWRMLMETLAAGRGISLPALSTAGVKAFARIAGAYSAVRKQFGLPIGQFEGVQEPLARIAGNAYLLEAMRRYTTGGLDTGAKPAVLTAMAKYNSTELCRARCNDAMDVLGGAGISRGPRNTLAHAYIGQPISITVEGANILTRTLMIFGQGAIRCHPYAYAEVEALEAGDVHAFDAALWGHVGHVVHNGFRALVLGLTRGRAARSPVSGPAAPYYRRLSWVSATFAWFADVAMATLGGNLKRKEKLTGRFADIFSWMYLANAALRRFEAEGRRAEDLPLLRWCMEDAFHRMQKGFEGILRNFDVPGLRTWFRTAGMLWMRLAPVGAPPSDRLGSEVAGMLLEPGAQRDRLTAGIYVPDESEPGLGQLELAFRLSVEAEPLLRRVRHAARAGELEAPTRARPAALLGAAVDAGIISAQEADVVRRAEQARREAVDVDDFSLEEYMATAIDGTRDKGPAGTPGAREMDAAARRSETAAVT